MDTRAANQNVEHQVALIKERMPETYKAIQASAKEVGGVAYSMVRRGLRGEPDCFWAMEGGLVMGTPFRQSGIQSDAAASMVRFGCAYACILQTAAEGGKHGAN